MLVIHLLHLLLAEM
jgi:hypothetical protein